MQASRDRRVGRAGRPPVRAFVAMAAGAAWWMMTAVAALDAAAAVLSRAVVELEMTSPASCDVRATYTIDTPGPTDVEHRIRAFDGTTIELLNVGGAAVAAPAGVRGRTQSVVLRLGGAGPQVYTVHYRAGLPASQPYRCPLWLPTVPADGRSRAVEIIATIPPTASPSGSAFPALTWRGSRGAATLGHLPAIVLVRYSLAGEASGAGWDVARVMDTVAVGLLVVGTAIFAWRRKGR